MQNAALVKGSLSAVALTRGLTLAECFLDCDAVVLVDVSASMTTDDVPTEQSRKMRSRYDEAARQLRELQSSLPGRIALVCFSHAAEFRPDGQLAALGSTTDMVKALQFIKPVDGCDVRFILVSDGEPDNPDATLKLAKQFTSHIDTVFCGGPDEKDGQEFLRKLSEATGGIATGGDVKKLPLLGETVRRLLLT